MLKCGKWVSMCLLILAKDERERENNRLDEQLLRIGLQLFLVTGQGKSKENTHQMMSTMAMATEQSFPLTERGRQSTK
jgi:hypothetical protein